MAYRHIPGFERILDVGSQAVRSACSDYVGSHSPVAAEGVPQMRGSFDRENRSVEEPKIGRKNRLRKGVFFATEAISPI